MPASKTHVYLHFVWATYERVPFITPEKERTVYRMITSQVVALGGQVIALGGMPDHVHLLVRFNRTLSFGQFMNRVKGASSRAINTHYHPNLDPGEPGTFRWQNGYAVFSVDYRSTEEIVAYIRTQKQHHASDTTQPAWENWDDE